MAKFIRYITPILIFTSIAFNSINAQEWVDVMRDPNATIEQKSKAFNEYWKDRPIEKGKGYKQFKRYEYEKRNQTGISTSNNQNIDRIKDYRSIQHQMTKTKSLGFAGKWRPIGPLGPTNGGGSGRINCIDFHPNNSDIIIIGSPSGGIWRTTNGGNSWTTNSDDLASIGISDICFAPSNGNIAYAATGDRDADNTYSHGILKSTDGGITWDSTGYMSSYSSRKQTYKLIVDPTNENIVYFTGTTGLFKTTDGGNTWKRIRIGSFRDIKLKPNDPNTIYLTTESTIFKSTNGGLTFSSLSSFKPAKSTNRLELAVTPADPEYLYVVGSSKSTNGFAGLYLSTNSGSTFSVKSTSPNILGWTHRGNDLGGQGWYDLGIVVSPTDKQTVFVGGVNIWKSTNEGKDWTLNAFWTGQAAPYVHADIHMMKYTPHNNNTLWACTDGGVSVSTDNGGSWNEKNSQLAIGQIYRLGISKNNADRIITGWQDNGSNYFNSSSWSHVLGGDGMECIISHDDPNELFASVYYGDISKSTDNGKTWKSISGQISEEGAWITPYIQDPTNANSLLAGYINVWKTNNSGSTWTKISDFNSTLKLNALCMAPSNKNVIWTANTTTLYKTTNGGSAWTEVNSDFGSGAINYIAINHENPEIVWVCLSSFSIGKKVYETRNGGQSWTNITGSLPNYPTNCIVNAPNTDLGLYLATDIGIYYRDTILNDWIPFMKGLPNVIVKELEIFEKENKIRAATYGRGVWESVLYPLANNIKSNKISSKNDIKIYPNPTKDIINIDFINNSNNPTEITIINSIGAILSTERLINKNQYSISCKNFPRGIYYIKITSKDCKSTKKIILY